MSQPEIRAMAQLCPIERIKSDPMVDIDEQ
jgi:hypothetical protein